ncbi:MAG: hypothetical protein K5864_01555 [Bacteroidales bacterium]|nr:hypothetical protein [Bacteroidales bacterium]
MENKIYNITDNQLAAWMEENLPEDEDALVTEALENDAYLRQIVEAAMDVEDMLIMDYLREIYRGSKGENDGGTDGGGLHPVLLFGAGTPHNDWDARFVQLRQSEMAEGQEEEYHRAANAGEERKMSRSKSSDKSGLWVDRALFGSFFLMLVSFAILLYEGVVNEKQRKTESFKDLTELRSSDDILKSHGVEKADVPAGHYAPHSGKMISPKDNYVKHNRADDFTFEWSSDYAAIVDVVLDGKQLELNTLDGKQNSYTIPASKLKYGNTMQWKITFTNPDSEEAYEGLVMLYDEVGY